MEFGAVRHQKKIEQTCGVNLNDEETSSSGGSSAMSIPQGGMIVADETVMMAT